MSQKLTKTTQRRMTYLIRSAMQFGRASNDLDSFTSAMAIVMLNHEFGIVLPCLAQAKQTCAELTAKAKAAKESNEAVFA